MIPLPLSPIDPTEKRVITFPFAGDLGDATLAGPPTVTSTLDAGDVDDAEALLSGAPQISGTNVLQLVDARAVEDAEGLVDFRLLATCATSDGRVLACSAILPMRNV